LPAVAGGAVTFVQRFGGLVNLNVHFHLVVPDGVFAQDEGASLSFVALGGPRDEDVLQILRRVVHRLERRLIRELERDHDLDDVADDDPDALGALQDEALATWRVPGRRTLGPVEGAERRRAWLEGFSLHVAVGIAATDREGLERRRWE